MAKFASILRVLRGNLGPPPLRVGGHLLDGTSPCERPASLYSRGPRSGLGFAIAIHQHLLCPIRPHSRAQHNFIARRLICATFAVRERRGDPRAVPGFRCPILPDMPSPKTPESSMIVKFQSSNVDIGLRRGLTGSALSKPPQSLSRGETISGLPRFAHLLRPASLLAPLYGSDRSPSRRGLGGLSPAVTAASLAAPNRWFLTTFSPLLTDFKRCSSEIRCTMAVQNAAKREHVDRNVF